MIGRLLCWLGIHKLERTSADYLGAQLMRIRWRCCRARCRYTETDEKT